MNNLKGISNQSEMEAPVIIYDIHSEIDLESQALLKLDLGQPGAVVRCISGTLWLTQACDLHDHLLIAGQSFTLDHAGIVLVQGLPYGRARIFPPAQLATAEENLYNRPDCLIQSDNLRV